MTAPTTQPSRHYRFADLTMDVGQRRVRRGNETVPLSKLSFDLLRVLVEHAPDVVAHEELASLAWGPRRIVTPENLAKRVMLLRQSLGDQADDSRYIERRRGHGYRLIPEVETTAVSNGGSAALAAPVATSSVALPAPDMNGAAKPVRHVASRRHVLFGALGAAVAAIAIDNVRLRVAERRTARRLANIELPQTFELRAPSGTSFGVSPTGPQPTLARSGRELAFVAPLEGIDVVWVQRLGSLDARPLRGTEKAAWPFWSAEGRFVAFYADGRLKRVAAEGGVAPTDITPLRGHYWGGVWADDNTVLYGGSGGLFVVTPDGGTPLRWTEIDASRGEFSHRFPVLLPDGRRFLYLALSTEPEHEGFYIGSLDNRSTKIWLARGRAKAALGYGPNGRLHLVSVGDDGELLAQPFDETQTKLVDDAVEIAPANTLEISPGARAGALTAGDRVLAYRPPSFVRTRVAWRDRAGTDVETIPLPSGPYRNLALSHDGSMFTVEREGNDEASGLWLIDRRRRQNRRLGEGNVSAWVQDDSGVVYSSVHADGWNVDLRTVASETETQSLLAGPVPFVKRIRDVTREGLVFQCGLAGISSLWYAPFDGSEPARELRVVPTYVTHGRVSPDGRWLAYAATDVGETHVYVTRFEDLGGTVRVSTIEGTDPQWRSDGRELYYVTRDRTLMAISISSNGGTLEAASPAPLFSAALDPRSLELGSAYAPAPDGQRFMVIEVLDQDEPRLRVTYNWPSDLER